MKQKMLYVAPETEQTRLQFEEHFLDGSITASRDNYTMDAEEDWEY